MERDSLHIAAATDLTCIECRRSWLEPTERWRMYSTMDDEPEVGLYCPICASFEFDGRLPR
jgi:hypothetical protein